MPCVLLRRSLEGSGKIHLRAASRGGNSEIFPRPKTLAVVVFNTIHVWGTAPHEVKEHLCIFQKANLPKQKHWKREEEAKASKTAK